MRNMHLEAAIWTLFTSIEFYEEAARECERTMDWFGTLAIARRVANFGRNNQIYDTFKKRAADFRRGAELARLGDYELIWRISDSIRGDARGIMEQPLPSWMTNVEYQEFGEVRWSRLLAYASQITRALNNAMTAGESFLHPDPDCPERSDDDDGFPGDSIVEAYSDNVQWYKEPLFWTLPDPLPEYVIDKSVSCRTGDEVPWTGVWYPDTGLDGCSLTFAIKGMLMQPVFRVVKTIEERNRESGGAIFGSPVTVAVATTWHPVISSGHPLNEEADLRAKAGEPCPKAGVWQPMEVGASDRRYEAGEIMGSLGTAYGYTVWRWKSER
ncbi:hypothetical protein GCM10025794_01920 [Massilia kyonggiensis]|nr:hypothetical protein [Massilia kyonggiensis]